MSVVRVKVNGEAREVEGTTTVRALVERLGFRPEAVAVAVGGEVVPRARLAERVVGDGDVVEIIRAVGGG